MTETEKILKKNLILLREGKGLTRYQLAKEMQVNRTYYYKMERMDISQSPTYNMLEKIANFYNIEVYELFKKI